MINSLHDLLNKHLNDANTFITYVKDVYSTTPHKVEFKMLFGDLLSFDGDYNKWIVTYGINHLINRDNQFDAMIDERIRHYSRFYRLLTSYDVAMNHEKLYEMVKEEFDKYVESRLTKIRSYRLYYIVVPTIMIELVFNH